MGAEMKNRLPVRITNLRTGDQVVAYESFTVTCGLTQVIRGGRVRIRLTEDAFLQDIIRIDVQLNGRWVPIATGQLRGVSAGDDEFVTFEHKGVADLLVESDVEPAAFGVENPAAQLIYSVATQEFGIPVVFDSPGMESNASVSTSPDPDFGTKAMGFLIEVAKRAGWLLLDDGMGRLHVCEVPERRSSIALTRGLPPFATGNLDMEDNRVATMYGNATLRAERQRGKKKAEDVQLWARVDDPGARTNTKQYFRSRDAKTQQELENEVARKSNAAALQGLTYTCTVDSFVDPEGDLWAPNKIILLNDARCRIVNAEMLIVSAALSQSADATQQAILTLSLPALYRPESAGAYADRTGKSAVKGLGWFRDGA